MLFLYSALEIRQGILKELQKNGYTGIEHGRTFYLYAKNRTYIFFQRLRYSSNTITFDIVIKDSLFQGANVIDSYTVSLSRELFTFDFKKKVVDDLIRSGYLIGNKVIKSIKSLSEDDIKSLFELKLKDAIAEENVYSIPQTIREERRNFTTYFEYIGYDTFGLEYRVSYVAKVIVEDYGINGELYDTKVKEYFKSVSLDDLKDSFITAIQRLKTEGFIEEKSVSMVYNDFIELIKSEAVVDAEILKKAFDMVYNKGKEDGTKILCRGFSSMGLPHLK